MAQGKVNIPLVGAIVGPRHPFGTSLLSGGKSLHPFQRSGDVAHTGMPVQAAASLPGIGHGPQAGAPDLNMPPSINIGLVSPNNPAARV